jgi:hypothetical protein
MASRPSGSLAYPPRKGGPIEALCLTGARERTGHSSRPLLGAGPIES